MQHVVIIGVFVNSLKWALFLHWFLFGIFQIDDVWNVLLNRESLDRFVSLQFECEFVKRQNKEQQSKEKEQYSSSWVDLENVNNINNKIAFPPFICNRMHVFAFPIQIQKIGRVCILGEVKRCTDSRGSCTIVHCTVKRYLGPNTSWFSSASGPPYQRWHLGKTW